MSNALTVDHKRRLRKAAATESLEPIVTSPDLMALLRASEPARRPWGSPETRSRMEPAAALIAQLAQMEPKPKNCRAEAKNLIKRVQQWREQKKLPDPATVADPVDRRIIELVKASAVLPHEEMLRKRLREERRKRQFGEMSIGEFSPDKIPQ